MPEGHLSGRRVLVVEDEYFLADELDQALEEAGATVLGPAPSVRAALDLLESGPAPDVATVDVNLGGEMAYPVAEALLARGVPFLFTTG
ncbi:response regulator [Methylobacterium sp. M6A4_1b]